MQTFFKKIKMTFTREANSAHAASMSVTRSQRVHMFILAFMPLVLYPFMFCIPFAKGVAGPLYAAYYICFLVHLVLRKDKGYQHEVRIYYILLLVFALAMAISLIYSSNIENGLKRLKEQLGLIFIPILIESVSSRDHARRSLYAYVGGGTILALIGIYQGMVLHIDRPPTLLYTVHEGHLLLFAAVVSVALILSEKRIPARIILIVLFLLQSFTLYLNGTRSAWAALGAVLIMVPFLTGELKLFHKLSYFVVLLVAVAVLMHSPFGQEKISETMNDVKMLKKSQSVTADGYITSLGGRYEMWKASLLMFSKDPVLGVGLGSWEGEVARMVDRKEAPSFLRNFNQTHNIFLDALSTRGIIGLLTYASVLFFPIIYAWNKRGKSQELFRNTVLFAGIAFMVAGSADTLIYIRWSLMSYIVLTGVGLALLVRDTPSDEHVEEISDKTHV